MAMCGFCGSAGVSKEHLWAGWLAATVLESRAPDGDKTFQAQIERGGETKTFPNRDLELTVKMPCEPCNNGWMSDLENDVRAFLSGMAFGGAKTILDRARQRSLVRWLVKTAMVAEFTSPSTEQKYFTEVERREFKGLLAIPENLWIWLGRYDGVRPLHSLQLRGPRSADSPPVLYSLTFGANCFVGQVFACRDPKWFRLAAATQGPRLLLLYPNQDDWISWPPANTIDDDELDVLDSRFAAAIGGKVS